MQTNDTGYGFALLAIIAVAYGLPTIVAFARHHHQRAAIMLVNLLLGWTALGWIVALVWSATATNPAMIAAHSQAPVIPARDRNLQFLLFAGIAFIAIFIAAIVKSNL